MKSPAGPWQDCAGGEEIFGTAGKKTSRAVQKKRLYWKEKARDFNGDMMDLRLNLHSKPARFGTVGGNPATAWQQIRGQTLPLSKRPSLSRKICLPAADLLQRGMSSASTAPLRDAEKGFPAEFPLALDHVMKKNWLGILET